MCADVPGTPALEPLYSLGEHHRRVARGARYVRPSTGRTVVGSHAAARVPRRAHLMHANLQAAHNMPIVVLCLEGTPCARLHARTLAGAVRSASGCTPPACVLPGHKIRPRARSPHTLAAARVPAGRPPMRACWLCASSAGCHGSGK
ncbi:hypothetical protein EON67_06325, partial [archaeon]